MVIPTWVQCRVGRNTPTKPLQGSHPSQKRHVLIILKTGPSASAMRKSMILQPRNADGVFRPSKRLFPRARIPATRSRRGGLLVSTCKGILAERMRLMIFLKALTGGRQTTPPRVELGGFLHVSFRKNTAYRSIGAFFYSVLIMTASLSSSPPLPHPLTRNPHSPFPFLVTSTSLKKTSYLPPLPYARKSTAPTHYYLPPFSFLRLSSATDLRM